MCVQSASANARTEPKIQLSCKGGHLSRHIPTELQMLFLTRGMMCCCLSPCTTKKYWHTELREALTVCLLVSLTFHRLMGGMVHFFDILNMRQSEMAIWSHNQAFKMPDTFLILISYIHGGIFIRILLDLGCLLQTACHMSYLW